MVVKMKRLALACLKSVQPRPRRPGISSRHGCSWPNQSRAAARRTPSVPLRGSARGSCGYLSAAIFVALSLIATQSLATPEIQSWHTENGAKVLFVEAPELPMLDVRIVFDAGSARDGELPGLAKITNGLMVDGAGEWNADQIAERFESVGAELGLGSLRDMAWLSVRTLTQDNALETSLATLTAILAKPTFEGDDIERNRRIMLASLKQEAQNPRDVAKKRFLSELFAGHPYASHDGGAETSLAAISRDDIAGFHRQYYGAANAVIALVGRIDRQQAEQIAQRLTAAMQPGEKAPPLPAVAAREEGETIHIPFPSSQSHLYIGQPGMYRGDPDYFTLYVGNHILGGSGLVSQLADEVREKRGLSYSVYSYFSPMRRKGPFIIGAQTKNDQADQAREVMLETLQRFTDQGPSEQQLKEAKQNITGGFPIRIAGNNNIVEYLGMIGFYDLPLSYLDDFTGKIEAVTLKDIRDAFKRRLTPENFLVVVLGGEG